MYQISKVLLVSLCSIWFGSVALANCDTHSPIVLEVRFDKTTARQPVHYDIKSFENIGLSKIVAETPWTEGESAFQGVLLRDLMAELGVSGHSITAYALNENSVKIPASDYENYDVIIATRRNGSQLAVREKGPLWVIYPWTRKLMLKSELYYSRSIWHLKMIGVNSD